MIILHLLWLTSDFSRRGICEDECGNVERTFRQTTRTSGGEAPCEAMGWRKEIGRKHVGGALESQAYLRFTYIFNIKCLKRTDLCLVFVRFMGNGMLMEAAVNDFRY